MDFGKAYVTRTGNGTYNNTGVDTKVGVGMLTAAYILIAYKLAANASGSNTVQFTIEDSADGVTYNTLSSCPVITLTTTAASSMIPLSILNARRYVRVACVIAGAGSTPTIQYYADFSTAPR